MKVDVISVVVLAFCLCVFITLALEAKTLFSAETVATAIVKTN
jgi:hypothetical protein